MERVCHPPMGESIGGEDIAVLVMDTRVEGTLRLDDARADHEWKRRREDPSQDLAPLRQFSTAHPTSLTPPLPKRKAP